jgi:hypothetical protein
MNLPIITNVHRNSYEGILENGTHWANVVHTRLVAGGPATVAQRQAMLTVLQHLFDLDQAGAGSRYFGSISNGTSLTFIRSTPLDGVTASIVSAVNANGVNTNDPLPGGAALCITFRTALRGRRNRGRFYIAGLTVAFNTTGGQPNSSFVSTAVNQMEATRVALLALVPSWELVVASYGGPSGTPPVSWTPYATSVSSVSADSLWDSQRRRNHS